MEDLELQIKILKVQRDILNVKRALNEYISVFKKLEPDYFRWITEPNACHLCAERNGRIYNSYPERPHPNCKCEIVEIDILEYERRKMEHNVEIVKRDNIFNTINNDLFHESKGKCAENIANGFRKNGVSNKEAFK